MFDFIFQLFKDIFFFAGYVGTNGSFPEPLSQEEERACLLRLAQGDASARTTLIEHICALLRTLQKNTRARGAIRMI